MNNTNNNHDSTPAEYIHLRRMPVADALYILDRYLDQAFVANFRTIRVIHGKGTGVLKAAVREELDKHPLVRSYRDAFIGEGDAGVTVVEMEPRSH
tara:strand:+ start:748 stop:1035 length:288 start_codon:yes stop_codon:yes gene_type:complete